MTETDFGPVQALIVILVPVFALAVVMRRHDRNAQWARDRRGHVERMAALERDVRVAPYTPQYGALTHLTQTYHAAAHSPQDAPSGPLRPATLLAAPTSPAPSFAALLDTGAIGPGRPLLLGYAAGAPLTGTWKQLYSSAIAGVSGSGKTTTLRFLAAQSALLGARFWLLDPHADAGAESLAGTLAPLAARFLAPPATTPAAMLAVLAEAQRRMEARLRGGPVDGPLIVAVDEFTRLMGRDDLAGPLARLIEAIAQEGRKVGCYALISGQIWHAERSGGTALRDALASAYIHRMKPEQARRLVPRDEAARAGDLTPGQALLARANDDTVEVTIPLTLAGDVERVAGLLGGAVSPISVPFRAVSAPVSDETGTLPVETDGMSQAKREAVRTALAAREPYGTIVGRVWGVTPGGGAAYKAACSEMAAILAGLVQQGRD